MKTLTFILILISHLVIGQETEIIKVERFDGVIFPKGIDLPYFEDSLIIDRFTPTKEQILKVEYNLKKELPLINKDLLNQGEHFGPIIHLNLKKYIRQYAGLINKKGEKIIFVNFVWEFKDSSLTNISKNWDKEWIIVFDGGSYYWQIAYNIDRKEFFGFIVNGVS